MTKVISIRIEKDIHKALKEFSKEKKITINKLIVNSIKDEYGLLINDILNRDRKKNYFDGEVEDMPLEPSKRKHIIKI